MGLRQALSQELVRQRGLSSATPIPVVVSDSGLELAIDFLAIDSLGCSFEQLALTVSALNGAAFPVLKTWADQLSRRITYLLEQIGPLEYDEQAGEVLIRSTPPDQLPDGAQYYEILLQSQQGGRFVLRRYRSVKGQSGRTPAALTMTHEVLLKLTEDLVDTLPMGTP
ncbi:MAG: hypothetical protein ACK5Q5_18065 [Planctomycetaceae bacterium]